MGRVEGGRRVCSSMYMSKGKGVRECWNRLNVLLEIWLGRLQMTGLIAAVSKFNSSDCFPERLFFSGDVGVGNRRTCNSKPCPEEFMLFAIDRETLGVAIAINCSDRTR